MAKRIRVTKAELKDNPVQDFLLKVQEFWKKYRRNIVIGFFVAVGIFILLMTFLIVFRIRTNASLKEFETALSEYLKIENTPDSGFSLTDSYSRIINIKNALEAFKKAERNSFGKYKNLSILYQGHCNFLLKNYTDALDAFNRFINSSGNKFLVPYVMREKGSTLEQLNQYSEAIKVYKSIIEKYPETELKIELNLSIGRALRSLKKYKEAEGYFNRIIEYYPESVWVDEAKKQIILIHIEMNEVGT